MPHIIILEYPSYHLCIPVITTVRQKLKTHLFRQSYPDIVC